MTSPSNLRAELASALRQRKNAIERGKSKRKDQDMVRAAMGSIKTFLNSYPYASDERVREWCRANVGKVSIVVIGSTQRQLARLLMDELQPRITSDAA
jgi:hypothetical protein